ncbi:MAG: Ig domain protein group 2 domain protein [Candidatus Parcubacteria bacterium]|nr:Ig domain protein group 2 domain protein [Candidatus Parcubacteria bacterium]
MNKKIIGLAAALTVFVGVGAFLRAGIAKAQTPAADGQFNCFDLFKFGSVAVNLTSETQTISAGSEMTVKAHIENQNSYPIVDGSVYIKVYRLQDSNPNRMINGDNIVEQMYAVKNITLPAHGSLDKSFSWSVPSMARTGKYQIVSYYLSADKFNLLGLPFTDDVHGAPLDFTVTGQDGGISLDKNSVTLNGSAYHFIGIQKPVSSTKPVVIQATVMNTSKDSVSVPVVARVYRWAQYEPDSHRSDLSQQVSLAPGQKKTVSFTVTDQESVTLVAIDTAYKDAKSILDVRFVRDGLSYPRLNFIALANYPVRSGDATVIFACAHAAGESVSSNGYSDSQSNAPLTLPGSKIVLTLSDAVGNVINKYTYSGPLTSTMMGFKTDLKPQVSYGNLTLTAEAYQGTLKLDSATMHYTCDAAGSAGCSDKAGSHNSSGEAGISTDTMVWIILGLLIILIILSVAARSMKKKPSSSRTMRVLVFALAGLGAAAIMGFAPSSAHASTVMWNGANYTLNYQHAWIAGNQNTVKVSNGSTHECSGGCMGITATGVSASVTYGATAIKNGVSIGSGTVLQTGDVISFTPAPFGPTDIFWVFIGGGYGTPYGIWNSNNFTSFGGCNVASDRIHDDAGQGTEFFTPVAVTPPGVSINVTGPVSGSGWGPYTVTGPGSISAVVTFGATQGRMIAWGHGQWGQGGTGGSPASADTACYLAQGGDVWDFNVTQQQIPFTFTVPPPAVVNQAPGPVVIEGPTTVNAGTTNTYTVHAPDPDGDNVYYRIDYDGDHSSIDQTLGTVPSDTKESFNKTFPSGGTYTIYAQAVDTSGAASGWFPYNVTVNSAKTFTIQILGSGSGTITSSPGGLSCSSGTCSASFPNGTFVTFSGSAGGGSNFTSWGGACGGFTAPNSCKLTMNSDYSGTATFNTNAPAQKNPISVTVEGNGHVVSDVGGIDCYANNSGTCNASVDPSTPVHLSAIALDSDSFKTWGGTGCAGNATACTLDMSNGGKSVTATFTYTLSVTSSGPSGSGTITGGGINCSAGNVGTCVAGETPGTPITLTPTPTPPNHSFTWNSGCSGSGPCVVTLTNGGQTVTGTFTTNAPPTTACNDTADNDGDGLVDAADPGCPSGGGGTTENGGGPLTSAVCSPSSPTILSAAGSVNFLGSAAARGSGPNTFEYSWDGGNTWDPSASKSVPYTIPGSPGPILYVRTVGAGSQRGTPLAANPNCGAVVVTGSISVYVGRTPSTATTNSVAVPQGKSFVVKWTTNLSPSYSCSSSIVPSSAHPSWSSWTNGDFSSSGVTGNMQTTLTTPIGLYSFNLTCTDGAATPGPTLTSTGKVRITSTTENEI